VAQKPGPDIEKLIDKLAEVSELGVGYSALTSGSEFLPLASSREVGALVIGAPDPQKSPALEQLVRHGAAAVPALLKHLDDPRKTRIPPVKGRMWTRFIDRHDYNRRTEKTPAANADEGTPEKPASQCDPGPAEAPEQNPPGKPMITLEGENHHLTVGDLCYVTLGQIVNRQFDASRYQPSAGLLVASPTRSKRLCESVRAVFKDFTREKHRQLLRSDFESPDHEDRRVGAYRRLAFYYPSEVDPLVLKQLAVPTHDVLAISDFLWEKLYRQKSMEKQRALFKQFVAKHGKPSSDGILIYLFRELTTQEAAEEGRLDWPSEEKRDPRSLLVLLYGYPRKVRSSDQPYPDTWDDGQRIRFVGALVHDKSQKVDAAVFELLRNCGGDAYGAYLAEACLTRLKGRFSDEKLRPYVPKQKPHPGGSDF
jgi:hypothetical protein